MTSLLPPLFWLVVTVFPNIPKYSQMVNIHPTKFNELYVDKCYEIIWAPLSKFNNFLWAHSSSVLQICGHWKIFQINYQVYILTNNDCGVFMPFQLSAPFLSFWLSWSCFKSNSIHKIVGIRLYNAMKTKKCYAEIFYYSSLKRKKIILLRNYIIALIINIE